MEEQDKRTEEQPDRAGRDGNGAEETQVGQVMQGLARVTRQLPATAPSPRPPAPLVNAHQRENILRLVAALSDPANPLHHQAVDELVTIGPAAVTALNEALNPHRPWLTAYRAAEALGQIGDGRAAGPLLEALRHPNSNVRWSAVRALAVVGDARALLDLRRVAREDRGKTSLGELVAGAAQSALNQMQSQNMILRGADLIKTAVACVLMLVSLILAWSVITDLREELRQVGLRPAEANITAPVSTARPTIQPEQTAAPLAQAEPTTSAEAGAEPVAAAPDAPDQAGGTAIATGNVRALPIISSDNVVGGISEGDEIVFLATTSDGQWYRIRLGERHAANSRIRSDGGEGWVNWSLLSQPQGELPIDQVELPTPVPTAEPTPVP